MNVEKKDRNIYTKELDQIDKYLVNIVKRFFQNDVETINNSAEAIIIEAVTRAKKEIRLDGRYGVSSINEKTGAVTITAADVGAEPMIITKYNAFNKNFGISANTICEGNDKRLSDERVPLAHKHKAIDVSTDANHEFVTDAQIIKWDSKADTALATLVNDGLMSKEYVKKIEELEEDFKNIPQDSTEGHIPTGGGVGDILAWESDGKAKWIDLDTDKITFESRRIKKRAVCQATLADGVTKNTYSIDISKINFYGAPAYNAYYINDDNTKEQLPTLIYNDSLEISDGIKAYIDSNAFTIQITRKNYIGAKTYKIYFEILDVDASLTMPKARSINVLNVYPDGVPTDYTFTNWKGQSFTLSQAAQCKMWMEKPNDETPKGYGQGLINVDVIDMATFSASPYLYLKDSSGKWKYDVVYLGAWDSNAGKVLSPTAINAIRDAILNNVGFIAGHDTNTSVSSLSDLMGMEFNVGSEWYVSSQIRENKKGIVSSFPWDLGELNTILDIPNCHRSGQFHEGDVWFQFESASTDVTVSNTGKAGHANFYLGTYNKTAFIQTGHSNGAATPDEQKILANVLYYLANK